jgi:transcriptional regulator of arginine metabolism
MKEKRQAKILELIQTHQIETQEELSSYLLKEGYDVTQATVSRDIRELKLYKVATDGGRQKYTVFSEGKDQLSEKFVRVFREGFLSIDMAQNILVVKTVSGMANAVCAAVDALSVREIVGSIAGDDTIFCATRSAEDAAAAMKYLRKLAR